MRFQLFWHRWFISLAVALGACSDKPDYVEAPVEMIPESERQTIVVFGASGRIGGVVVEEALGRGHRVIGISRSPEKFTINHASFSAAKGDMTSVESFREVTAGADAVIISVQGSYKGKIPETTVQAIAASTAVAALTGAAFGSSGERCMALSVAVCVGDAAADALVSKMSAAMQGLKVGAFCDSDNDFGPVITPQHKEKINGYIHSAETQGASIVVDGRNPEVPGYEQGFFVGGTLIDHVKPGMTCYEHEIFGPVLLVVRADSMDEAMKMATRLTRTSDQ